MAVPTTAWNESSPAGSDNVSSGDDRIREMKTQIREVIDVDHDFPSSGNAADNGQHKKVTLQEQANLGTGAEGVPILGAQTVGGKAELVFTDEDDNDVQITKAGYLNWVSIAEKLYPVGFVVTLGVSTNPATLFGVGTWTAIEGKVIVGISNESGDEAFDTLNETGGEQTHTLTTDEMPAHTHTEDANTLPGDASGPGGSGSGWGHLEAGNTGSAGGGGAHNNLQPYIVKYVWERVS